MKKRIVIIGLILVFALLFTQPGQRILFYLEWKAVSTFTETNGLYSPILREYYCSDGRACRHEQGHKEDHSLGWFSETLEFEQATEILRDCEMPGLAQLPYIQFVLSDEQLTGHELYAELYTLVDISGFDNLTTLLNDYAEQCK